ncbi:cupin domain-containing protein [Eionea flava]
MMNPNECKSINSPLFKRLPKKCFLSDYWQQKPYFFEGVLADDMPVLSQVINGNALAGMACEPEVESRLIFGYEHHADWYCEYGGEGEDSNAFDEERFAQLPENNWTLLVQGVDQWYEEAYQLLSYFDFLPQWRLEDIMASYAPVGGGVGPHFDYYDVFLIQVSGERQWKLGQQCDENSPLKKGSEVKLLHDFYEEVTYNAKVGDVLYIPAGKAHWGTASSDDCITLSVGFRAPSQKELLEKVLENLLDHCTDNQRYQDPKNTQDDVPHSSKITSSMYQNVEKMLQHLTPEVIEMSARQAFGMLVTEPRYPALDHDDEDVSNWHRLINDHFHTEGSIEFDIPVSTRIAFSASHLFVNAHCYTVQESFSQSLSEACIPVSIIGEEEKRIIIELLENGDITLS